MKVRANHHVKYGGRWYAAGEEFLIGGGSLAGLEGFVSEAGKSAEPVPLPPAEESAARRRGRPPKTNR